MVFMSAPSSAVDLDPVVAQRVAVFQIHEAQAGRTFDGARIEQDRDHLGFAVHLVEEHRHVENPWRHRCHTGKEDDRILWAD